MFRRSIDEPTKPVSHLRKGWESLCPAGEMQWMLRRETARADRTGRPFCLVLFKVPAGGRRSSSAFRLARELLRLARLTDEVGWYSDDYLAALLPDTPAGGAKIFAARVSVSVARRAAAPQSLLYVYPETALPAGNEARLAQPEQLKANGNGHANGNGYHNGHGLPEGKSHQTIGGRRETMLAPDGPATTHAVLVPQTQCALPVAQPGLSSASVQELLVHPIPAWKRFLDIAGALFGLLVLFPVMAVAAIGIRLTSPGPIIFRQKRSGLGGRPFLIYKFRTMTADAEKRKRELRPLSEQDGPAFKIENDPRLTRFGRFLRKTSIDELPQLWNVLKGDMSLVGPRPLPCDEAEACRPWHRRRLDVTPGLTCIWQVKGRSRVTFDEWVRMDVAYMRRRTLAHDLWLLIITIPAVLLRRGAR